MEQGCQADILQLDVTGLVMDPPPAATETAERKRGASESDGDAKRQRVEASDSQDVSAD